MTFYGDGIARLKKALYPHDELIKQIIFLTTLAGIPIADKELVSKIHFIRLFEKYYGRTPNQYLQELRIEKAKRFLQRGNSLVEVCNAIGFASKTFFIALFKKKTGKTPVFFQNQHRK
ncbi:MAG TPA: helix-turn-helix transcriptional regulator [Chitinophagaceae bacterium]|nr:helix-turn-helix transcriptional regulator [Chitinophagaceae bacterium]